ncbi:hypothetical protein ETAA8_10360 [Anatilimnocola aggregata]|uniref:N-acetyltransferase domain-containing protein n=1 Tax=Anatilimnocola aggregata TaxID=2528021 RepID=A0A517Y6U9_9BACT|nr:hypothetical protein [Anatilimnocola aggregata]QDU25964.1 hypothetical protein ETAA8_10360 [Anatilimnocola aggregata]
MTPSFWENIVLAKPYFDRQGLIVACDGARPIGFVHAGFGASADHRSLDTSAGTICQLLTMPHPARATTALELLSAGEDYLRKRGAKTLHAGCAFPFNPFYVGLYGSSDVPGVLASDLAARELFSAGGYTEGQTRVLLHRKLTDFKPPISGQLLQVKRKFQASQAGEVMPGNWWDNCVWSQAVWTRFQLAAKEAGEPVISITLWEILPLSQAWGARTIGLVSVDDTPEAREQGLTLFLLSETLRMLKEENVSQFEAQCLADDATLLAIFKQLGVVEYDRGSLLQK